MTGAIEQGADLIKFDMNRARMAQHEVERAVDFAADVAGGGSVVVHTGEYMRPLTDMYIDPFGPNHSVGPDGRIMFKQRITEDKDAKFYLIDDRTGQAMSTVEKDRLVAVPDWNRYDTKNPELWDKHEGKSYTDEEGNTVNPDDYIDYRGNLRLDPYDPIEGRVPQYDRKNGRFRVRYMSYDDFLDEAHQKNEYKEEQLGRPLSMHEKTTQTEAFLQATLETNEGHSRGWALQYGERTEEHLRAINEIKKAMVFYEHLDKNMPEDEKWKLLQQQHLPVPQALVPPPNKTPMEVLTDALSGHVKGLEFARQASVSQQQQAEDTAETKRHIVEPIKYVERFAIKGYAEAGLHAMTRTLDPNKPVFLSMEQIYPERFGGHPQELRWLIETAREKMVEMLTQKEIELGLSYEGKPALVKNPETGTLELQKQPNPWYKPNISVNEAEKLAAQHIRATIDTGHLNLWRKYFQPRPGSTPEQNEAEFRTWFLTQVEDLAKDKMVGNLHLTDNFGYQDDHLAPGQGNAPLRQTLAILKKHGYKDAITVEPGADASTDISDFHGLMKTWRYLGSSIYGMGSPTSAQQKWSQVQYSYFGQNQPPYFIFGAYAPSNEWTLWSQVPME
ncbi:MAG: TIM barrel protein [Candidatus Woesearchaeota archaeon]